MSQAAASTADRTDVSLLCDIDHGLTPWEIRFAEDMKVKVLDRGHPLTERQREVVDRILERFNL